MNKYPPFGQLRLEMAVNHEMDVPNAPGASAFVIAP